METARVHSQVRDILARVLKMPAAEIGADTAAYNTPAWDSAAHMQIVLSLQEQFGVEFPDEQVVELLGYSEICEALHGLGVAG